MAPKNDTASMSSPKSVQMDTGVSNVDDLQAGDSELIEKEKMLHEQTQESLEENDKLVAKIELLRDALTRLEAAHMHLPVDRAPTEEEIAATLFNSVETLFKEAGEEEQFKRICELSSYFENMTAEEIDKLTERVQELGRLGPDVKVDDIQNLLKASAQNKDERLT